MRNQSKRTAAEHERPEGPVRAARAFRLRHPWTAPRAGFALAIVAAALWGLAPVATKSALRGYSPEMISVVRLGFASLFFRWMAGPGATWLPAERWSVTAGV